jgi:excisionase family DNA binding protein
LSGFAQSPCEDTCVALLTLSEVGELLHVSMGTVRRLVRRREIACVRFGKTIRVHPDAVATFVKSRMLADTSAQARQDARTRALAPARALRRRGRR